MPPFASRSASLALLTRSGGRKLPVPAMREYRGIGVVMPREVLTLCNLCRAAAAGDVEARAKALELEAAFHVLSSYDEGPDLVLYFKYMLLLQGETEYALHFIETDTLSASQRGYVEAQFALFNTWFAGWSKQGGAVARCLA